MEIGFDFGRRSFFVAMDGVEDKDDAKAVFDTFSKAFAEDLGLFFDSFGLDLGVHTISVSRILDIVNS